MNRKPLPDAPSVARRLAAEDHLNDATFEALAAVARHSPEAVYWYARDAVRAARALEAA